MSDTPPGEEPTIAPGELLKVCAEATRAPDLEKLLANGYARLFEYFREEFRLALTTLLQAEPAARDELVLLAATAMTKIQKVRRSARSRTRGNSARAMEDDPDSHLDETTKKELDAITRDYQQEMAAVLREFDRSADEIVRQFAGKHLHVTANARAIVEYNTGFTLEEPSV